MEKLAENMQQAARPVGRRAVLGAMLGGCLSLAGCDFLGFKNWQWNQRLILEVETPHGVKSGGSVVTISASSGPEWLPGEGRGGMGTRIIGEASFVEVTPSRYLFALLGDDAERALVTFFPEPAHSTFERAEQLETMQATRELLPDQYPLLVTFADINDPTTVQRVDPNNLAATFGSGVSLKRIMLEITDEKVTEGRVRAVSSWMDGQKIDPTINNGRTETLRYPNESPRGYGLISTVEFVRE